MTKPSRLRFPLMLLAMASLLFALWAGLVRLGWQWPSLQPRLPVAHGPLMVSGFLGTLIGVERALALRKRWTYIGPGLSALGGILLVFGVPGISGPLLITLGSLGLVAIFIVIVRSHATLYTTVMGLGSVALLVGNLLWLLGWPVYRFVLWWGAFLVLTIAGERLELGRLVRLSENAQFAFMGAVALYLAGLITALFSLNSGVQLASAGMLALSLWLLRYDIARRTIYKPGLPRFAAACLLSGYIWLGASGIMGIAFGEQAGGVRYDAFLHAVFLGFVFSMIFGHAPIIFPAVLGFEVSFHPVYYLHLLILHISLGLRIYGDLAILPGVRLWGGLLNAAAILIFIGVNLFTAIRSTRAKTPRAAQARKSATIY